MASRVALLLVLLAACAKAPSNPDERGDGDGDGDGDTTDAAQLPDAPVNTPDALEFPDAMLPDACVAAVEECDGDDDDCDDIPDNGCSCTPNGSTQQCYTANPSTIGVGPCMQGTQTCTDGEWGATCAGEVTPTTEVCDGVDNDCNVATADGSAVAGFGSPCDGGDLDTCNEGVLACNGTAQVCNDLTADSNVVLDTGFEAGDTIPPSPWSQSSTAFGTPVCSVASCGTGGGTGPRAGTFWAWFGGTLSATTDSVSQSRVIPTGTASLTFFLEVPACATGGAAETLTIFIDGTQIFQVANVGGQCNTIGYAQQTVAVPAAFANGATHSIEFRGVFDAAQANITNYFVDDVRLVSCP